MQSILQVRTPSGAVPSNPSWSKVTLDQLLCQRSGINSSVDMFDDAAVAAAYGVPLPITKYQEAGWGSTQGFDTTPGSAYSYSNFNFSLLGQVLEKKTGKTYEKAVQDAVFAPLGVSRPRIGRSQVTQRLPQEVLYPSPVRVNGTSGDDQVAVASVMNAAQSPSARSYGGWNQANLDAAGGWVMAPADWAKVLSSFDDGTTPLFTTQSTTRAMWTDCASDRPGAQRGFYATTQALKQGYTKAHEHNGSLPSNSFLVIRRDDGTTMVLGFNQRVSPNLSGAAEGAQLFAIANAVTTWPTHDLFPSLGIPPNS